MEIEMKKKEKEKERTHHYSHGAGCGCSVVAVGFVVIVLGVGDPVNLGLSSLIPSPRCHFSLELSWVDVVLAWVRGLKPTSVSLSTYLTALS